MSKPRPPRRVWAILHNGYPYGIIYETRKEALKLPLTPGETLVKYVLQAPRKRVKRAKRK